MSLSPEALEDKGVSWKIYQPPGTSVGKNLGVALADGFNIMLYFKQYVNEPNSALCQKAFLPSWPNDFEQDVKAGTLPAVSWVLPPLAYSEHPNGSPVAGQYFTHRIISALQANKEQWAQTVVVLCYDENGGLPDYSVPTLPDTPLNLQAGCPTLTNPVPFVTPPEPINIPVNQSMPSQEPGKPRRR